MSPCLSPAQEALAHHIGKWQRREPEMALAEVFCPLAARPRFRAWGALLFELREAMFELSDARVTAVKTGWWAETLLALAQGQGRHPLTEALLGVEAPWSRLARAVIETPQSESRPADTAQALRDLENLSAAVASVEAALFEAVADAETGRAIAIHYLLHRLPTGLAQDDAARVPMSLLARHGLTAGQLATSQGAAALDSWGDELRQQLPRRLGQACLFRRLRSAFDAARLQRLAAGRGFVPPPAPMSVWLAWRAARSQ